MSSLLAFQRYQQVVTTPEFRSQLESLSVNDLKKYLFLVVLGPCCCPGFSLVEVRGHLIMVACLVSEPRLQGKWASGVAAHILSCCGLRLQNIGSIFVAYQISCSEACGIFLLQGSNPCFLCWQEDSLPLSNQGSPSCFYVYYKYKCIQCMLLP